MPLAVLGPLLLRVERAQRIGSRGRPVPRSSSGAGTYDWDSIDEGIVREVAKWLPRADARRARLACRAWRAALAGLCTAAATPAEASTVTRWRAQLESMVVSMPCLRELTVGSRLSDVGGQQLAALAVVPQLRCLRVPHGHSLRDRGVQAIAQLTQLTELQILGANALTGRALCTLSMLGASLRVLDVRGCCKLSWAELRESWLAVCRAYVAAAEARGASMSGSSSGGGAVACAGAGAGAGARGAGGSCGGVSLQQLLPGGAEVLQRQRAAGRLLRGGSLAFGKERLALGGPRRRSTSCSGGRKRCGGSSDGGIGCGGRVAFRLRPRRNSTGSAALGRGLWVRGRDGAASGSGSREHSAAGEGGGRPRGNADAGADEGGGAASVNAAGGGDPSAPCGVQLVLRGSSGDGAAGPSGGVRLLAFRVVAAKACPRGARQPPGGAIAATNPAVPQRPGPIFKAHSASAAAASAAAAAAVAAAPAAAVAAAAHATAATAATASASRGQGQGPAHQEAPPPAPAAEHAAAAAAGPLPAAAPRGPSRAPETVAEAYALVARQPVSIEGQYAAAAGPVWSRAPPALALGASSVPRAAAAAGGMQKQRSTVQAALLSLLRAEERRCGGGRRGRRRCSGVSAGGQGPAAPLDISDPGVCADAGGGKRAQATMARARPTVGAAASLPMPFPHLHTLAFSLGDGSGARGGSGGGPPAAQLAAVAAIGSLTSLEVARCQQVSDDALACLTALTRLSSLKLSGLWSAGDRGLAAVGALSGLTALTLVHPARATARGLAALSTLTRLESLALSVSQDVGAGASARLALALPRLRELEISYPGFGDACCEALASDASKASRLASLRLHDAPSLTARGLAALRGMRALETLSLDACGGVGAGALLGQGALAPRLSSLALRRSDFANMFAGGVLERPACAATLVALDLSGCGDLADRGLRKVAGFLPSLRDLNLSGCASVTDAGLSSLACLRSLRALVAGGTHVMGGFAEALAALPGLTSLSLRGCAALAEPAVRGQLTLLTALQALDLSDCRAVTDAAVISLAGGLPGLGHLNIQGCRAVTRQVLAFVPHWLRLQHCLA